MDWTVLQLGLKQLIASVSGIAPFNVAWDGEPEMMRSYPMAMLEVMEHRREGQDEVRHEPGEDGQLVPVVHGNRLITLKVTVKSRDQRGSGQSSAILERARTLLESPRSQEALDELEVSLRDASVLTNLDAVSQQREESIAQISITLAYTVAEPDEDNPAEPVEHVQVSGEIHTQPAAQSGDDEPITVPEQTIPEEAS